MSDDPNAQEVQPHPVPAGAGGEVGLIVLEMQHAQKKFAAQILESCLLA